MPRVTAAAVLSILLWPGAALGQIPGVDIFVDQQVNESGERSRCDLINAANADLVVLSDTAELMLVSTQDTILEDTFVDEDNNVFIGDQPVGFIDFATDGDGFRTLWWLAPSGFVVWIDTLTLEATESEWLPTDFVDVPCNACDGFWDNAADCPPPDPGPTPDRGPIFRICGAGFGMLFGVVLLGLVGLRCRPWLTPA